MHAPLIFAGPGVPKGKQCDALCYLLDIYSTLGELVGVRGPDGSEGKSLVPVMAGKQGGVRGSLFTAYRDLQRSVRDERWKLIVYPKVNKVQLFDLENDPYEIKDLAGEAKYVAEKDRMLVLLRKSQDESGDTQPLGTNRPEPLEFDFSKVKPKNDEKP